MDPAFNDNQPMTPRETECFLRLRSELDFSGAVSVEQESKANQPRPIMVCSSVSISGSPIASMTKDMPREHNSLQRSHSGKDLCDPSGVFWE
uniref:Uncharacterized protein n=1 Tax=Nelumbo nucifera TaxID=4432 RepID=A0A822XWL9_NELNU|nr:TPA_asm: hypothetical protein HUJ06_023251 [Nelumbo nucifera]